MKRKILYVLLTIVSILTLNDVYASDYDYNVASITKNLEITGTPFGKDTVTFKYNETNKLDGIWRYDGVSNLYDSILIEVNDKNVYTISITFGGKYYTKVPLTIKEENGVITGTYKNSTVNGTIKYYTPKTVNLLIISPEHFSYGFVADLEYDEAKLKFISCDTVGDYNIKTNGKRIVVDSPVQLSSMDVGICYFENLVDNYGDIKFKNIQTSYETGLKSSTSVKINESGEVKYFIESSKSSIPETPIHVDDTVVNSSENTITTTKVDDTKKEDKVTNPKTGVKDLSILIIVIGGMTIVAYKYQKNGKFFKKISLFILLFIPFSVFAVDLSKINATEKQVEALREYLLLNGGKTVNSDYDIDGDKYVTINDLIYAVISYHLPRIEITNVDSEKGKTLNDVNVYSVLNKKIKTTTVGETKIVTYCKTDKASCVPNKMICAAPDVLTIEERKEFIELLSVKECGDISLNLKEEETGMRICIQSINSFGVSNVVCDSEKYYVDPVKPVITAKSVSVQTFDEVLAYDYHNDLAITYGKTGGDYMCKEEVVEEYKTRTVTCNATGNNGLKADEKAFTISTSPTAGKNIVFYGDSLIQGDSVGSTRQNNGFNSVFNKKDFANVVNAGSNGCTVIGDLSSGSSSCMRNSVSNHSNLTANINFDYVVIEGGVNDASEYRHHIGECNAKNTSTFREDAKAYINYIKGKHPGAKFILLKTYNILKYETTLFEKDPDYGNCGNQVVDSYQSDLHSAFTSLIPAESRMIFDMNSYKSYLFSNNRLPDGLHLNAEAYKHIGEELYNKLYEKFKAQ